MIMPSKKKGTMRSKMLALFSKMDDTLKINDRLIEFNYLFSLNNDTLRMKGSLNETNIWMVFSGLENKLY